MMFYRCFTFLINIFFIITGGMVFFVFMPNLSAAERNVVVSYQEKDSESKAEIKQNLTYAIKRKDPNKTEYTLVESLHDVKCMAENKCVAIEIVHTKNDLVITFYGEVSQKMQVSRIPIEKNVSDFDVAQMLAMKIFLLVKQFEEQKKPKTSRSEKVVKPRKVAPENTIEEKTKQTDAPTDSKNENGQKEEKKAGRIKKTDDKTAIQPFNNRWEYEFKNQPENRDTAIVHLQLKPVFVTGFEYEYNTGGLELGCTLRILRPLAIKFDIGYYPNGRTHKYVQTYSKWSLLPAELSIGYRDSFDNWYVAGYGGFYTMQVWSSHRDEDEEFSYSQFMYGVSLTAEAGYNFHKWVSLGLFIRPFYLINNYKITMYDPYGSNATGEDQSVAESYTGFKLPKFQMMIGFVININF